jgi:predicted metal-dependent enzyme (double-stranded beta helix superfamily)
MLLENQIAEIYGAGGAIGSARVWEERAVVAGFVARINALGPLSLASPALQARLLAEVQSVARHIDGSAETGAASGYDRRVLYEDPGNWSLAAIILRPGQQTHPHDHGGWGCAVTVQGVERDQRFVHDTAGTLLPIGERDYPPGTGYVFDAAAVHQPAGADPHRVTVALHFLVHGSGANDTNRIVELLQPEYETAA